MKNHRLSNRHSLLLLAAALTTMIGGCSCGLGNIDGSIYCPVFDNSVTEISYACGEPPKIIGKTNTTLLISKPVFQPASDPGSYFVTTRVHSLALDGMNRVMGEIDFVPQVIAANEDYIAWVIYPQSSVKVRDLHTQEEWIAAQSGWSEYVTRIELVGNRLATEFLHYGNNGYTFLKIVDLASRQQILPLDDQGISYWDLSDEWLAVMAFEKNIGNYQNYVYDLKLYSLDDARVIDMAQTSREIGGLNIDPGTNAVYWLEIDDLQAIRLMRWDFSTGQTNVEDPQFVSSPEKGNLIDVSNNLLVGWRYKEGTESFFALKENTSELQIFEFPYGELFPTISRFWQSDYPVNQFSYPVLIQNHIAWLDVQRSKVMVFDADAQSTTEFDIP